jgi:hypothetical protein
MIEILGVKVTYDALAFLVLFAASELLPFLPIKGNGLVDLILRLAHLAKPLRSEDEKIAELTEKIKELTELAKK